jgi:ATP phosphoribosyltransferase regulatory subunit HisZ
VNEDRAAENDTPRDQLPREGVAELEELRRQRDEERRQAEARLAELRRRAEAAETRVAKLEAEIGEGVLGRLRSLCEALRRNLPVHWPRGGGQ